jgi:protein phosphatase
VDAGELTEEEAEQSERRNIILQALGPDPRVKVDLSHQQLRRDDTLILCSDGLSGLVRREEFAQLVESSPDLPTLCSALIDLANERGGPDNVTVVAVRFDGEGLATADSGDGAGYQSYDVPDGETSEGPTTTVEMPPLNSPAPPTPVVAESLPAARWHALLLAAAVVALIALVLTVVL